MKHLSPSPLGGKVWPSMKLMESTLCSHRDQGGVWLLPLLVGSLLSSAPPTAPLVFEFPLQLCPVSCSTTRPVPRNNSQVSTSEAWTLNFSTGPTNVAERRIWKEGVQHLSSLFMLDVLDTFYKILNRSHKGVAWFFFFFLWLATENEKYLVVV